MTYEHLHLHDARAGELRLAAREQALARRAGDRRRAERLAARAARLMARSAALVDRALEAPRSPRPVVPAPRGELTGVRG